MPTLKRDIRDLGNLLGRTLVRQEGEQLLALVERVRLLIREDRGAAAALLGELEPACATPAEALVPSRCRPLVSGRGGRPYFRAKRSVSPDFSASSVRWSSSAAASGSR